MAIAAQWQTVATAGTASTALYTTATSTASTFQYQRDLVITNGGTVNAFIAAATGANTASTTQSFVLPAGGSLILTQCQVPNSTILFGVSSTTAATCPISIGYATNVAYV